MPDPFRDGREVIVDVRKGSGSTFVGAPDSLITKCPSKFSAKKTDLKRMAVVGRACLIIAFAV